MHDCDVLRLALTDDATGLRNHFHRNRREREDSNPHALQSQPVPYCRDRVPLRLKIRTRRRGRHASLNPRGISTDGGDGTGVDFGVASLGQYLAQWPPACLSVTKPNQEKLGTYLLSIFDGD